MIQSYLLEKEAAVELGKSELNAFLATPPGVNTKFYCMVKNNSNSNYSGTMNAEIKNNIAVLRISFSDKGNYSILFRGELWKGKELVKMDTLTMHINIK